MTKPTFGDSVDTMELSDMQEYEDLQPTPRALLATTFGVDPTNATFNDTENETFINSFYFYESVQFAVMWFLLVAIVVGNSSVIVALQYTHTRKSRMNYFIMQLAIADLCVGLISVLTDIAQHMTVSWLAGAFMCKFVRFLQVVVTYSSTYVLVALSIDRCDAITHPMNFSGSWNRARGLVLSAWLLSVLFSIPILLLYEVKVIQGVVQCWIELGSQYNWRVWMVSVSLTLFVLPALTIAACYAVIVATIWTKSKVVMSPPISSRGTKDRRPGDLNGSRDTDTRRASSRGLIPRAKIKTVKMTFVIVFVFIMCWSPYIVFDLLQVYDCIPRSQTSVALATLVQSLAPLNSAANPLICVMFSPHILASLKRLLPAPFLGVWCGAGGRSRATLRSRSDSTALSDLLTTSNRRTMKTHDTASVSAIPNNSVTGVTQSTYDRTAGDRREAAPRVT